MISVDCLIIAPCRKFCHRLWPWGLGNISILRLVMKPSQHTFICNCHRIVMLRNICHLIVINQHIIRCNHTRICIYIYIVHIENHYLSDWKRRAMHVLWRSNRSYTLHYTYSICMIQYVNHTIPVMQFSQSINQSANIQFYLHFIKEVRDFGHFSGRPKYPGVWRWCWRKSRCSSWICISELGRRDSTIRPGNPAGVSTDPLGNGAIYMAAYDGLFRWGPAKMHGVSLLFQRPETSQQGRIILGISEPRMTTKKTVNFEATFVSGRCIQRLMNWTAVNCCPPHHRRSLWHFEVEGLDQRRNKLRSDLWYHGMDLEWYLSSKNLFTHERILCWMRVTAFWCNLYR